MLVGTTLAVPALVRADNRTVAWAPNLRVEWDDLAGALDSVVPDRQGEVAISNDANCAAYAEAHHGAARGTSHALYVTGTVGIGAGIVQDGELVRGGAGFAGEVGHMAVGEAGIAARRASQAKATLWREIGDLLRETVAAEPALADLLERLETKVSQGLESPYAAAGRLLAALRNPHG